MNSLLFNVFNPSSNTWKRVTAKESKYEDAARVCATSNSHFMYFFRQVTGQPFLAYLNQFRIAKARSLLTATDRPISEISQEVGFWAQSHFGVVFRKLVGMTPLGYRCRFHLQT